MKDVEAVREWARSLGYRLQTIPHQVRLTTIQVATGKVDRAGQFAECGGISPTAAINRLNLASSYGLLEVVGKEGKELVFGLCPRVINYPWLKKAIGAGTGRSR